MIYLKTSSDSKASWQLFSWFSVSWWRAKKNLIKVFQSSLCQIHPLISEVGAPRMDLACSSSSLSFSILMKLWLRPGSPCGCGLFKIIEGVLPCHFTKRKLLQRGDRRYWQRWDQNQDLLSAQYDPQPTVTESKHTLRCLWDIFMVLRDVPTMPGPIP